MTKVMIYIKCSHIGISSHVNTLDGPVATKFPLFE